MIGIDSNILINVLRNKDVIAKLKMYANEDLCTSEIVVYEIFYGLYAAQHFNENRINEFYAILDTFTHIFPIDRRASVYAAKIAGNLSKTGNTIDHRDALIAGSLIVNGCNKFITENVKDFEKIKELEIVKF
jgi:predicted nucleic acid-binding protein